MKDNAGNFPGFSGDDFANDKEIMRLRRQAELDKALIEESVSLLNSAFGLTVFEEDDYPDQFIMFKNLNAGVVDVFCKSEPYELKIIVAEYTTAYPTAKSANSGTDAYLFGKIRLKKSYPITHICRETVREKLIDLLTKRETDFPEHKKFSNRFHVLTQDPARLTELFRFSPMDELVRFPDMELEIQGDHCLYRISARPLSPEEAIQHIELTKVLLRIFG